MKNRTNVALALLLGTIFLPNVMNKYQPPPACDTAKLQSHGPTIQAVATAVAEGEQWAIDAVETWEAAGRPTDGDNSP